MKSRLVVNLLAKMSYFLGNSVAFITCDILLNGNYKTYGYQWFQWLRMDHNIMFHLVNPGNVLLPTFGFCEIQEASMDVQNIFINKSKFICEISPNILYQYNFIVLWFVMVLATIISLLGVLQFFFKHYLAIVSISKEEKPVRNTFRALSLREWEYLLYIRNHDAGLYGEVVENLKQMETTRKRIETIL